jgi:ribonucleoside-diphosphate reductase alpha chain
MSELPPAEEYGPQTEVSRIVHQEKYRGPNESFDDFCVRFSSALGDTEPEFREILDLLRSMRWLPAGRQQLAVGSPHKVTAFNCYVSDKIPDDWLGIMNNARDCGQTLRMGGGVGMDFSSLRPSGALIRSSETEASGPVSFMKIWDAVCSTIQSRGLRRGAMMGVLRVDHPDIEEFIRAKRTPGVLTNFNVSVAITDKFMEALANDEEYDLVFQGTKYGTRSAKIIWEEIMRSTWDWAEPGVLFIDRINHMNPLAYCESIAATNPCGEQPLPPNGACLLGSMNCTAYLQGDIPGEMTFDLTQFEQDVRVAVRSTDKIIDRTNYPLPAQEAEAKNKRRMGIGVTGMANTLELMGYTYGSDEYINAQSTILRTLRDAAYWESMELARERGPFPMFDADRWLQSGFAFTLPQDLRAAIKQYGLRNGLLLSVAPTGTISFCADNVSSGIEPPYSLVAERDVILSEGKVQMEVLDWAYRNFKFRCTTADEISVEDHVRVLCAAQEFVDSSISKTCNVGDHVTFEDFKNVYLSAYENGAKGCTTFRAAGKRYGMMRKIEPVEDNIENLPEGAACFYDPETGQKECA